MTVDMIDSKLGESFKEAYGKLAATDVQGQETAELWRTSALFTDGGSILKNPSSIGGTWAWCLVDGDKIILSGSGVIPANGYPVTNNFSEYVAAVFALEAMPVHWSGFMCADSLITLGRLFLGWKTNGIPEAWTIRAATALKKLSDIEPQLLQGHPTKADLERGIGAKRELPVSKWNLWADKECNRVGAEYLKERELVETRA